MTDDIVSGLEELAKRCQERKEQHRQAILLAVAGAFAGDAIGLLELFYRLTGEFSESEVARIRKVRELSGK